MRSSAPLLPTLLGVLLLVAPAPGQALEPLPGADPWRDVDAALISVDQVLLQQLDPALWRDVRETAQEAIDAVRRAKDAGAPADICMTIQLTVRAVLDHQDLLEGLLPPETSEQDAKDRMVETLGFIEGRLPQAAWLLVEILFGMGRDDEAQDLLSRCLVRWPARSQLHDQIRAWRHALPAPEDIIVQINRRIDALGTADSDFAGLALQTIADLHHGMGLAAYDERKFAISAAHFEAMETALHRSRSMPRKIIGDELAVKRADALVDAGYSHYGVALDRWYTHGRDDEEAAARADAAEQVLARALESVPDHAAATDAIFRLGDLIMNKADPEGVTDEDLAQAREFFGRMARRFENADWWNNHAFWCRETGTTAETEGRTEEALVLYEQSYQSYRKAIELAPDNARYVNDTGLMLYYHLGREFEEAERLFHLAWDLGREVCENPFVEDDVYEENFSAYTDAMLNLARLYHQQGRLDEASTVANELVEIAPTRLDAQLAKRDIDQAL